MILLAMSHCLFQCFSAQDIAMGDVAPKEDMAASNDERLLQEFAGLFLLWAPHYPHCSFRGIAQKLCLQRIPGAGAHHCLRPCPPSVQHLPSQCLGHYTLAPVSLAPLCCLAGPVMTGSVDDRQRVVWHLDVRPNNVINHDVHVVQ